MKQNKPKDFINDLESSIDNQLITFSGVLLAAILLINKNQTNKNMPYLVIGSILCLILTVLFTLWHKWRSPRRIIIFDDKRKQIIGNYSEKIANFAENMILPLAKLQYGHAKTNNLPMSPRQAIKSTEAEQKSIIESFLKNMQNDLKYAHSSAFNKPLKENGSNMKYIIDVVARASRHYIFLIGVILFFASITMSWL